MHALLSNTLMRREALWLAVLLNLAWGVWSVPLFDVDEGAFTEATREMMASGNYVSIYLNGEPRHDKPILIYWAQAASAHVFGLNEFSLRLPSVLAALAWVWAIFAFTRRQYGRDTAHVAALLFSLSLYIGIIARAAIADALLNLFIVLAMLDIFRQFQAPGSRPSLRIFLWLGLGFLTKGPVAVVFPFLVSGLFYLSYGRWRDWLAAVFDPRGLALFVAIVLPWHVAVYLDTGWAFFEGFYLHHNLDRYSGSAAEGHGGSFLYYLVIAPLMLLPFTVWLLRAFGQLCDAGHDPFARFAWIWFFTVLLWFSFSSTKLPHYMMYGLTGAIIMMAVHRERLGRFLPYAGLPLLLLLLVAALPQVFELLATNTERAYEKMLFEGGAEAFAGAPQLWLIALALASLAILWIQAPSWQRMLLLGYTQAFAMAVVVIPGIADVQQGGPRAAAIFAREAGKQLVLYRTYQPSVSVYARQVIRKHTELQPGQWIYVRTDKLPLLLQEPSPYRREVVFQQGSATLVAVKP